MTCFLKIAAGLALAWMVAGCSSVSVPSLNLKEMNYRESRVVTHPAREVYDVTIRVLEEMSFTIDTKNVSKGELTAYSRVLPGSNVELKRQRRAVVSVKWTPEAMTEIRIGFWESTESDSPYDSGVTSEKLLRGGALYDAFWAHMGAALPLELPPERPAEPEGGASPETEEPAS